MRRYLFNFAVASLAFSAGVGLSVFWFYRHVSPKAVETPAKEIHQRKTPIDTAESLIILERTQCYGPCPMYKVVISGDGTVIFDGKEFVKEKGLRKGRISAEALYKLWQELQQIDFFAIPDDFLECPHFWTDSPTAKIKVFHDGKFKYVSHYHGCQGTERLEQLTLLESHIDEAANTKQWIGK